QIRVGLELTGAHDGVTVYYRSRPLMLALGVSLEDAAAGPLARDGSFSGGRDIGVVFNLPRRSGATVLPACGGVGAQYTPAAGWAQAIRYRHETLGDQSYARSIAVVLGGDASCATNGFWSALNIATTLKLPLLFYIEDNGFGISVSSHLQTPGGNIAANLRSFSGLTILEGDGSDPGAGVERAVEGALARPPPDPGSLTQHVFFENPDGTRALQEQGGLAPEGHVAAPASRTARPSGPRINMLTAIRRTLDVELALNPRM